MRPHRGVLVLVFGILGLVACQLFGIAAWVMASADLEEMAWGRMDASGRDLTNAGRICGMIATGLLVFQILVLVLVLIFMMAASH